MDRYDFSGWATRNDIKCTDGRIIRKDAFKHCDGMTVPLVWNHDHTDPYRVLGHAMLENRDEGVYAYCSLNDTDLAKTARVYIEHGDIKHLSIYANKLKQQGPNVMHGHIRELSLVLAGANPGAYIENVMIHGDESDDEAVIAFGEDICLYHSEDGGKEEKKEDNKMSNESKSEKTVADVFNTLNEEQKTVVYALIGQALEDKENEESEDKKMSHNVFDQSEEMYGGDVLTHSDQMNIIALAKNPRVGTLQNAIAEYFETNGMDSLQHDTFSNDVIEALMPDYKDVRPGAPELLERDHSWVGHVMRGTHKSPISRIRTRQADARIEEIRAHGYKGKGNEKKVSGSIKLLSRTTDPQTVYYKDSMHRDDIIDMTDFDTVGYMWGIMKRHLEEEIARAILIGDGREDGDEMKIAQEHIRSIWHDDELYTIHVDVDIEAARKELQGTATDVHFGENYIYAEAIITKALYAREKYKGSGSLEFYCTPHLLNVMLLARDLNGRRIYSSKADLAAALNVTAIHTVEQFEGKVRKDAELNEHKLLGIFVNLSDYQIGSTKGGEITKFDQFDIDYNQYKYLIETRISGALTRVYSAIALEEPVKASSDGN